MNVKTGPLGALLALSHQMASAQHPLAILGEGNTSARSSQTTFLVKASGSNLATLSKLDLVECRFATLLPLLDQKKVPDAQIDATLLKSRVDATAKKPSVEALFHAWFLSLPEVNFVGHSHAPAVNSILCSKRAREFASKRIFPDEIVCCDVASVFVPYADPGLRLAQAIREQTLDFIKKHGRPPRVVLLESHGIVTLGRSAEGVVAAMLMAEKAATIWLGAAALGGPVFLPQKTVDRIARRPDEEVRRRILRL